MSTCAALGLGALHADERLLRRLSKLSRCLLSGGVEAKGDLERLSCVCRWGCCGCKALLGSGGTGGERVKMRESSELL